jgi:thioredoxin-related protein
MENFFLNIGFSWTLSKSLPFVLMLLLGILLVFLIRRRLKKRWMRNTSFVLLILPVVIYFVVNPIYEGDFSNDFRVENTGNETKEIEKGTLSVITIPGCPFCLQSIATLKVMKDRTDSKKDINFIVCSDSISDLKKYEVESDGELKVKLAEDIEAMVKLAGGAGIATFPTFVYTSKSGEMTVWSNDGFGVMAKDWVEDKL